MGETIPTTNMLSKDNNSFSNWVKLFIYDGGDPIHNVKHLQSWLSWEPNEPDVDEAGTHNHSDITGILC